jgi:stage V sporulation protein B
MDVGMTFAKPTISAVIMGVCAFATYKLAYIFLSSNTLATFAAVIVGVLVYAILILATKAITKDEISKLPKGQKLVKVLDKFIK